jgi:hypothetical protein
MSLLSLMQRLKLEEQSRTPLQATFESASAALSAAIEAEKEI